MESCAGISRFRPIGSGANERQAKPPEQRQHDRKTTDCSDREAKRKIRPAWLGTNEAIMRDEQR